MRKLIPLLTLLLAPFIAGIACAQQDYPRDFSECWDNPTHYTDGSLIQAGDLETIRIEVYRQNDTVPAFTANFPATGEGLNQCETLTGAIPQPGTYVALGYAIVVGDIESDASEPSNPQKYVGKPLPIIFTTQ